MTVLSVNLASRRYADNGIALLEGSLGRVTARLVSPENLGLRGEPQVEPLARALSALAGRASRG